ncbi:hypothetical protein ICE98_00458 [Lactococcus lactis]|nr:hypothetical protein [Lactococcus lactis]
MPVAGVISSSLVGAINFILQVGGGISGFVLGVLFYQWLCLVYTKS